ncbi:MAG: enoyl-CoA hydratase/isomerase family protein [Bradyrhizobium sp.]
MTSPALQIDIDNYVATLQISRPQVFNALNAELMNDIESEVRQFQTNPAVRAIVITGSGYKSFSAGADLGELAGLDQHAAQKYMQSGQRTMRTIEQSTVPVIAAVNGLALGGGFELVLASTFAVLSTNASLGLPEAGLGLIPGYGGTQRLTRRVGAGVARFAMLTGRRIEAHRAYELGLAAIPPVEPSELQSVTSEIAISISERGPRAVEAILRAVDMGRDAPIDSALALETILAATAIYGDESAEGIRAFNERRTPNFADIKS